MRYFIDLKYRGTEYHGWQIQKNALSVQQVINEAISTILGEKIETTGSGRTDTGVHALQQIAHFDTLKKIKPEKLAFKLNSLLPKDMAVNRINPVISEAHARFDAFSRSYEYRIIRNKNPFLIDLAYYYRNEFDLEVMNAAAEILKTYNDFQSFSKVKTEVNHFRCQIKKAIWKIKGEELRFYITADRFLRGMVRAVVGTMIALGERKISMEDFNDIILSRDRKRAGSSVPPHGLYLTGVRYPKNVYL